ncbi:MAG: MFS transporter [Candidatus Acidiferrales bacterium]
MLSAPVKITARIAITAFLSFLVYLVIGMQLAVMPVFVHVTLKFSPLIAGVTVSMQYVATLLSRPRAGTMSDSTGAKRTVMMGIWACIISGALLIVAALGYDKGGVRWAGIALAVIFISRLFLGTGESFVATGQTLWGIGRVGHEHTPQVISWSGVMGYSAVAAGAPLGVWIGDRFGMEALAVAMTLIPIIGYAIAKPIPEVPPESGEPHPFPHLLERVYPHGLALAAASVGFGCIASFATLYYASRNWPNAALTLTIFGICFVVTRLIFAGMIPRYGGLRVVAACLVVEMVGLLMLWRAGSPRMAMFAAAVTAIGFALVFPSLGVEAVRGVSVVNRGSVLGIFTAFFDLALGVSGPAAGVIVTHAGYSAVFLFAAAMALTALGITYALYRREPRLGAALEDV